MQQRYGWLIGLTCGMLGLFAGLYFAAQGLESSQSTGESAGLFCGYAGALIGITCAIAGTLSDRLRIANKFKPRR